jgi:hypothetical protein
LTRTALIDGDIILYELGFSGQIVDKDTGELKVYSWDEVKEFFDKKLNIILTETDSTDYCFYLTNTNRINKLLNRSRIREEAPPKEFVPNFREKIAVQKGYKANRKQEKPKHFYNVLAHILGSHPYHVDENGLEADDAMCIRQYSSWEKEDTIICSRDKDVRQCPGYHYSWEINKQPSIGPIIIEPMGFLEKKDKTATGKPKPVTLFGGGHKFFYAQLLMGDNTDNIGGLQGYGPVFAYNLLNEATTERQLYELVAEMYVKNCGDDWKTLLKEQADLLYMVRDYKEDGTPKLWLPPRRDE